MTSVPVAVSSMPMRMMFDTRSASESLTDRAMRIAARLVASTTNSEALPESSPRSSEPLGRSDAPCESPASAIVCAYGLAVFARSSMSLRCDALSAAWTSSSCRCVTVSPARIDAESLRETSSITLSMSCWIPSANARTARASVASNVSVIPSLTMTCFSAVKSIHHSGGFADLHVLHGHDLEWLIRPKPHRVWQRLRMRSCLRSLRFP